MIIKLKTFQVELNQFLEGKKNRPIVKAHLA